MLNFNNVPADENPKNQELSLIPIGTIARAVVLVQMATSNFLSSAKANGSSVPQAQPPNG